MGFDVVLRNVSKSYKTDGQVIRAISRVSFDVAAGDVVGVMGPSGSGKSTLLHVIGAMDRADEGSLEVGGTDVSHLSGRDEPSYRRTIGFVFQRFHLLPALTALDNVVAPVLPYRTGFDKFERGRTLLDAVGLAGRESSLPSRLSGGEQQRVAIARALINEPGLLLADEPTGNLDSGTGGEIVQLILELRRQRGMTVLVATHDPLVASQCDRVIRLRDGKMIDDLAVPTGQAPEALLNEIGRLDAST